MTDAVAEALGRWPVLPEHRDKLDRCAAELRLFSDFARLNDLPRAQPARKFDGARSELERLATLSRDLGVHILAMHRDALQALESTGCKPHPLVLFDDLKATVLACVAALESGEFPDPPQGAPKKVAAAGVTAHVLRTYEFLTGRRATIVTDPVTNTAGGPFLAAMTELLPLLGVSARPESQARAAITAAKAKEKSPAR